MSTIPNLNLFLIRDYSIFGLKFWRERLQELKISLYFPPDPSGTGEAAVYRLLDQAMTGVFTENNLKAQRIRAAAAVGDERQILCDLVSCFRSAIMNCKINNYFTLMDSEVNKTLCDFCHKEVDYGQECQKCGLLAPRKPKMKKILNDFDDNFYRLNEDEILEELDQLKARQIGALQQKAEVKLAIKNGEITVSNDGQMKWEF